MVMYMHVILFFICLNIGMGVTAIPDTPLTIDVAGNAQLQNCFDQSQERMIVYNSGTSTWERTSAATNSTLNTPTQNIANLEQFTDQFGGSYDPVTDAIDAGYSTIDFFKGIVLGGFITNAIDSITLTCDFSQGGNPVTDDPVMQYFKTGLNIIFGFMLVLLVLYLVTGKSFGL